MDSTRQQKISRLLQRELGNWFRENAKMFHQAALISVTKTTISSDLSIARVYLSFFNCDADECLTEINGRSKFIRGKIGMNIGKQMRIVPEFHFYHDDSLDYIDNIERLLKQ